MLTFCCFFTEAMERMRFMLQSNSVPSTLAINRLVQALGNSGCVAEIQELELLIKRLGKTANMSSMIFVNNTVLSHINK